MRKEKTTYSIHCDVCSEELPHENATRGTRIEIKEIIINYDHIPRGDTSSGRVFDLCEYHGKQVLDFMQSLGRSDDIPEPQLPTTFSNDDVPF